MYKEIPPRFRGYTFYVESSSANTLARQNGPRLLDLPDVAASILDNSFEGVLIVDDTKERLIRYVNAAWEKHTGWSAREVVGIKSPNILKSGQQNAAFYDSLWKTLAEGRLFHAEIVNRRRDESLYDAEINIFPLRAGGETLYVEVSRDVTAEKAARRQLEEEKQREQKRLESLVAEKTRSLNEKVEELERINGVLVGRELRMIELKKENAGLKEKARLPGRA